MSHQGTPEKADYTDLKAHSKMATKLLGNEAAFIDDFFGTCTRNSIKSLEPGGILLLENTRFHEDLKNAHVSVFHGTAGIFENDKFGLETTELLKTAANSVCSIAGEGHTLEAVDQLGLESKFSHVSMGGGASITHLSGETLRVIESFKGRGRSNEKRLKYMKERIYFAFRSLDRTASNLLLRSSISG